jgi:hypothetical protein
MSLTAGTVAGTPATATSLAVNLADTNTGALNVLTISVNSTGTGVQPTITTPTGWTIVSSSWKSGSPSHEIASFYRFRQAGDPTSVTISWANTGNAAIAPVAFSAGMIDTTTPIVGSEKAFSQSAGPTTVATSAITLAAPRYVLSVFGNRSNATWSAAADGNVHDAILVQGIGAAAADVAVCGTGTTTSSGAARSLLSSASTSVHNCGIMAFNPATTTGFYARVGGIWKSGTAYVRNAGAWQAVSVLS